MFRRRGGGLVMSQSSTKQTLSNNEMPKRTGRPGGRLCPPQSCRPRVTLCGSRDHHIKNRSTPLRFHENTTHTHTPTPPPPTPVPNKPYGFCGRRTPCLSIYFNRFTAPACKVSGLGSARNMPANSIFSGPKCEI